MPRGGQRQGAGRPTRIEQMGKPPKNVLSCRVEAETMVFFRQEEERTGKSIGELIDIAVAVLQKHRDELPPDEREVEDD